MKRFLFLAALLLPLFLVAQNQKKVAVYVMGEDEGINKVLGSKLVSAIAQSKEYTAIERTAAFLAELNKEQKYQRTGAVDDSELSRLGKQFGVQYVCVAAVSEAFNEKYLSVRLIDVESAQVERTASSSRTIQSLPDLIDAANSVSYQLTSSSGISNKYRLKKVAVYIVKNDASKNIGRVLGDKLVTGFTYSGTYNAIERTNSFLAQLNKEQNYQRAGTVDDSDISRLGKQFGVQYVCVVDVSDVFGEKYISARLIDVETAEIVNTYDIDGKIDNMETCVRKAEEIASELSGRTFAEKYEYENNGYFPGDKIVTDLGFGEEVSPYFKSLTVTKNVYEKGKKRKIKKTYPEGNRGLMEWINDNIKYPASAQKNGIQGRVICNFVVERDGSITDIQVVRAVDPSLDKEAVRVLQNMPNWEPGKQDKRPVRTRFSIPLTFRLM